LPIHDEYVNNCERIDYFTLYLPIYYDINIAIVWIDTLLPAFE
jgi:hypothetical protein